jgi:hypothetical protein
MWHNDHDTNSQERVYDKRLQYPNMSQKQKTIQVLYVAGPLHMWDPTIL